MTSAENSVETRVIVRPIASGLPLGFFAFSAGMLFTGCLQLHWLTTADAKSAYLAMLIFVVPLELIATVAAIAARDTVAGTALGVFTGSWAVFSIEGLINGSEPSRSLGVYAFLLGVIALAIASVAVRGQPVVASVVSMSGLRSILLGIFEVGGPSGFQTASGVVSLCIVVVAVYGALALLLEEATGGSVLPMARRGAALAAMEDGHADPDKIAGEPGVRSRL